MRTIAIASAAVLVACTPMPYINDKGEVAPKQLVAECEYDAAKATASATDPNPLAGPYGGLNAFSNNSEFRKASLEAKCMELKGYKIR